MRAPITSCAYWCMCVFFGVVTRGSKHTIGRRARINAVKAAATHKNVATS